MYRRWWEQFVQDVPVDVLEGTEPVSGLGRVPSLDGSSLTAHTLQILCCDLHFGPPQSSAGLAN